MNRILIDGRLISEKPTGISRYCLALIKNYINRYGENAVYVLCNKEVVSPFKNNVITKYKPYNLLHFFLLSFWIRKQDFTLFHATTYSGLFLKRKGMKYLVTVHDVFYRIVEEFFSEKWVINRIAIFYYDFIVKMSLRNADHIISVSHTTKADLLSFFKQESCVIAEGVNIFNNKKRSDYKKQNFFLYVGNLRKQKNVQLLIDVFASLPKQNLIICGSKKDIQESWLSHKNINFVGHVSDAELVNYYCQCKAFIYPSFYEGFGLPILEALSFETLVFSSNGGALKEFSNPNIYQFDPYDSGRLKQLIQNADNFIFDKLASKNMLERYSWDNVLKEMDRLLD